MISFQGVSYACFFLVIFPLPGVIIVCAIISLEGEVGLGHVPGQVLDLSFNVFVFFEAPLKNRPVRCNFSSNPIGVRLGLLQRSEISQA